MDVLTPPPKAQILIVRHTASEVSTIGDLLIPRMATERLCYTLEDTMRAGADGILQAEEKIQDKTAIPSGIYELELNVSGRFGFCPFVLDVPLFKDVRIHWGNTAVDTRGCLLVGRTKAPDFVGESMLAFKELMMVLVPMRRANRLYIEICGGLTREEFLKRAA